MRPVSKFSLRSLSYGLLAAVIVPVTGFASLFEVQSSSISQPPYAFCGRIESQLGGQTRIASGGIAGPGVVLTAADVLWNESDGFASNVVFQRGRRGSSIIQSSTATFIVLIKRFTTTTNSTARIGSNVAGLFFRNPPAGGQSLDLRVTRDQLVVDSQNSVIGYVDSIGNGTRMAQYSGVTFTKISGSILYSPSHPSSFSSLAKGAPVIHTTFNMHTGVVRHLYVGIVVDRGAVRSFTSREVQLFTGTGA